MVFIPISPMTIDQQLVYIRLNYFVELTLKGADKATYFHGTDC